MKVLAVLDIPIGAGGGFDQALPTMLPMSCVCKGRFDLEVVTGSRENVAVLERLSVATRLDVASTRDHVVSRLLSVPMIRQA